MNDGRPIDPDAHITVRDMTLAFGDFVVLRDLDFKVKRNDVFVIMGGSGCGKSTLLRHLIGLLEPAKGQIFYDKENFTDADARTRRTLLRRFGVLYQSGGLFSSMTLAENVGLPLGEFTDLAPREIREIAHLKLALVGLAGFEDYYPAQISGGMQKRAGLARAMALDPEILFFDEPSAGLDPISSNLLDRLILELRDGLGTTIVVVTHELASIFAIASDSLFLDAETRTAIAQGPPKELLEHGEEKVHTFLTRGEGSADPVNAALARRLPGYDDDRPGRGGPGRGPRAPRRFESAAQISRSATGDVMRGGAGRATGRRFGVPARFSPWRATAKPAPTAAESQQRNRGTGAEPASNEPTPTPGHPRSKK